MVNPNGKENILKAVRHVKRRDIPEERRVGNSLLLQATVYSREISEDTIFTYHKCRVNIGINEVSLEKCCIAVYIL